MLKFGDDQTYLFEEKSKTILITMDAKYYINKAQVKIKLF